MNKDYISWKITNSQLSRFNHRYSINYIKNVSIPMDKVVLDALLIIATLKAEIFAGRNVRESPKSRNFSNLSFANFILWRKFTEKTFAILGKSSFLDGNNFRERLGKVNNNHFKSQFNFFLQYKNDMLIPHVKW